MKKKRINYFKFFSLFFALAILVFMTGCSGTTPAAPLINSFSASPTTITAGESASLSWSVTDAASVTIDQSVGTVALSGTTPVYPTTTTTYTLTATNTAGSVTAQTTVTVTLGSALTVTYDGNGATAGTVPVDPGSYQTGATVTVLGNTGDLVRIHSGGTSYRFTGWNTKADGSGANQTEGTAFSMGTSNVILYAQWIPYVVGDIGPAGGYIFYDKGVYSKAALTTVKAVNDTIKILPPTLIYIDWRYLEAAPASTEWTGKQWGSDGTEIGGTETGIGAGKSNTATIVTWLNSHSETGRAAQLCHDLTVEGYTDWFLPSKDELNLMYENLKVSGVGDFADYIYWSSSEGNADDAWYQAFDHGSQYKEDKNIYSRVRAVRAF